MKSILCLLLLACGSWTTRAQGVLEFTAFLHGTSVDPPSPLPYTGSGVFTLSNSVFNYDVTTDYLSGFRGGVYGPAGPGANGPLLFDLAPPFCTAPNPVPPYDPGACWYWGSTTIPAEQIPDLMAGLWYIQITSRYFPELAMRGQVVLVPEPTSSSLFACALATALAFRIWRKAAARDWRNGRRSALLVVNIAFSVAGALLVLLFLAVQPAAAATNNPRVIIPPRALITNGTVTYYRDKSKTPALPAGVSSDSPEPSPPASTDFYALGWDQECWDLGGDWQQPPDTQGAVGTNHVMTMLNTEVRVQNRGGANLLRTPLPEWWSNARLGSFGRVLDPRVVYDPFNHRWIAVVLADDHSTTSALFLAVSLTSCPTNTGTNGWNFLRIPADTNKPPQAWLDQPTVGFNRKWIVVHGNMINLTNAPATFACSHFWIFDKTNVYAGGSNYTFRAYTDPDRAGAIIPAVTLDDSLETLYLAQNANGTNGCLRVFSITGSIGSEVLNTNDGSYVNKDGLTWADVAPNSLYVLPQLGTATTLFAADARLNNVVYRNGCLWAAHHVFLPPTNGLRTAVQWWQINPTNTSLLQCGRIEDATNFYAFPTIAANRFNDVLVGYSRFSTNQYPSANYSFRAFYDRPINALRPDRVLKEGEEAYTRDRWGDYSATVVDPLNDADFWTIQEYTTTNPPPAGDYGRWATWWGQVKPEIPPNDDFSASFVLSGAQGSTNGNNIRARKENGEPTHFTGMGSGASVWYRWGAPTSGSVIVTLAIDASQPFDGLLAVYSGSSLTNLSLVASNHCGTYSFVVFEAGADTIYRFVVDGFSAFPANMGQFTLNWLQPVPPLFVVQPRSTNVLATESVTFSALAVANPTPGYYWRSNEVVMAGATGTNYTTTARTNQIGQTNAYTVVASNGVGMATSAVANLFVHDTAAGKIKCPHAQGTSLVFHVHGVTNRQYGVETTTNSTSTNLVGWALVGSNYVSFDFTNSLPSNGPPHFFRAKAL